MINQDEILEKLFGSKTRVKILAHFLRNENKSFSVNEVIRKTGINANLASKELRKLASLNILFFLKSGNAVLYQTNSSSTLFESLKSIFLKNDWFEWERPARIHHLIFTLEASLKPMKKYYGLCWPNTHLVFNYDNVTWFFKMNQFRDLGKKLIPIYQKKKEKIWNDFYHFASDIDKQKNYPPFYKNYLNFWKVAYITEPISFYIDSLLKPDEHVYLDHKSFTDEYEDRLWELSKKAEKIGLNKIDVRPILKEYYWIRNSYYGVHQLTEEEIKTEISKKINKKRPLQPKFNDPKSLSPELLKIAKEMIYMQDLRKKYTLQAAYFLHELLKKIGQKYGFSVLLMHQTLPGEVLSIKKYLPDLKEKLNQRLHSCTITGSLAEGIKVYDGQTFFPKGLDRRSKLEIRGKVACGGKAVGRAKIINKAGEIYKVNHGDVIVSPMTTPDFIPAIRRCVAMVTNFGGITCHAAIISREFNLPCIVATNNATEIIKDGDLLEVDADNGLVKVIQDK